MTYLEIVNKVLTRLREETVSSVSETPYSRLIGDLVNAVKREVEDAWNWTALTKTITATTNPNVYSYGLTDTQSRAKIIDVVNDTTNELLQRKSTDFFTKAFLTVPLKLGVPKYYNINGVNFQEDHQMEFYPIPDGIYDIRINVWSPQPDLTLDENVLLVPSRIVIEGTIARAISERGDDGGYADQEGRYLSTLSDFIAIEANMFPEEITWGAV
jgi:hypothetical protein